MKPLREIELTRDRDGKDIVLVPLAGCREKAKLFPEDHAALRSKGLTENWNLNSNGRGHSYVRCKAPAGSPSTLSLLVIARLITKAKPGQMVRYRDKDRLNLRSDNLILCKGSSCWSGELEVSAVDVAPAGAGRGAITAEVAHASF